MWKPFLKFLFIAVFFNRISCKLRKNLVQLALQQNVISTKNYVFWPNATVPFYVNPEHFDHEQSLSILTALSMFAFKTCLKFAPVMAAPASNEHVLVLENTNGVRRCVLDTLGHSVYEPNRVTIGYDCLQSPQIDMMLMRTLGFPFEHNRINREIYIDVLEENIELGSIDLFTKEATQPFELRAIPYDINSVMHFGTRDFSKNGHRTILFKDHNVQQNRVGLTKMDLRKIEVVYGPECRVRDRQEKFDLCQSYPGVARKKRDVYLDDSTPNIEIRRKRDIGHGMSSKGHLRMKRDLEEVVTKSLRVNPHITPPPNVTNVRDTLKELGIEEAVQEVVEKVFKVSALALKNAREKYCNNTKPNLRTVNVKKTDSDVLGIIEVIANYAQDMVDNAVANLTKFCEESESIEIYQRARCSWNDGSDRCRQTYRSTKSGAVKYSTQHRPVYFQSTNHRFVGHGKKIYARSGNDTDDTTEESRSKRDAVIKDGVTEPDKHLENEQNKGKEQDKEKDTKEGSKDKDDSVVLRSGTTIPGKIRNRYEPMRRQGRRNRARYSKDDIDYSSLSIENERPRKKKHHRESLDIEDRKKQRESLDIGDRKKQRESLDIEDRKKHRESLDIEDRKKHRESLDIEDRKKHRESLAIEDRKKHRESLYKEDRNNHGESLDTEDRKKHRESLYTEDRKKHRESLDIEDRKNDKESAENDRQTHRESAEEDRKQRRETADAEVSWVTKKMKRKERDHRGREENEEEKQETEYTTERHKKKRPRKEQPRREGLPRVVQLSKANEEFYQDRRWPGGVVRYLIKEDTTYDTNDLRRRIKEVNDILKRKTCVRLKELTEDTAKNYEDYITIGNSPDYVTGRVGGKQKFGSIELFRGDQHRQHTAMMVMAMLGFYFEVSRHDRDKYVRVHMRHVRPDKLHHFEKIREDATLPLPYDYNSATHPAWQYWRQLGKSGISTVATYKHKDPDGSVMKSMGQNSKLLSEIDIVKINSVYGIKCFHNDRSKLKEN